MADKNHMSFMGRLTADPTLNYTGSETPVSNFNVVTNRYHYSPDGEKQKAATFFRCTAWRGKAEMIAEHFRKGNNIGIEGHFENEDWEDNSGNKRSDLVLHVDEFHFLDPRSEQPNLHQDDIGNRCPDGNSNEAIPF